MKPALSVIMPVYNGEKTLEAAIESVLRQTEVDIEVIVVNDGSRDSTKQIIERYKEKDSRIVFVDKEKNGGLSAARNSGLEHVSGEYFTFVDADDWIEPGCYERLLANAKGADVVVSGFYHDTLDDSGNVSVCVEDSTGATCYVDTKSDLLQWVAKLDRMRLFAFTCNKLYNKKFFDSLGIIFQNQTLIEDYEFNCYVFDKVNTLSVVDGCFYHYIKFSRETLSQKYLPDYFEIIDKRYVLMKTLFEKNGVFSGENREIICSMHIKHVLSGIIKNCSEKSGLSAKEQKAVIKSLFKDKNCLEAIKYAKGQRKQEIICNVVFSTKSVFLNYMLATVLYSMQNSKNNIFDKLK